MPVIDLVKLFLNLVATYTTDYSPYGCENNFTQNELTEGKNDSWYYANFEFEDYDSLTGNYTGYSFYYTVSNLVSGASNSFTGTVVGNSYTFTGTAYSEYNNMIVGTLRSRGVSLYENSSSSVNHGPVYQVGIDYDNNNTWVPNNLQIVCTGQYSGVTKSPYATFLLSGITKDSDTFSFETSLLASSAKYITKVLGVDNFGKSTFTTKIANHAFNLGYNVLQIFFEDNPKIIQRKHFTLWTGIHPDDLSENKTEVMEKVKHIQSTRKNKLIMKKLASDTVTMNQIKNQVRKMIAEGTKIDMIILDYIDCVVPDKMLGDEWKSEGSVMRGFEAMCHELDIAGWTATQGNRNSISSEVVTTDQMGGSIKKAQVGHVIITVAKSLQQKEMNLATIAITKSRISFSLILRSANMRLRLWNLR